MNLTRREAAGGGRSGDKQGADVLLGRGKPRQLHGHQYLRRHWRHELPRDVLLDAAEELSFSCVAGLRFKAVCKGDATGLESFVEPRTYVNWAEDPAFAPVGYDATRQRQFETPALLPIAEKESRGDEKARLAYFTGAIRHYERMLAFEPTSLDPRYSREARLVFIDRSIEDPLLAKACEQRARIELATGDAAASVKWTERLVAVSKNGEANVTAAVLFGDAAYQQGDWDRAADCYRLAHERLPWHTREKFARALYASGQMEEALKETELTAAKAGKYKRQELRHLAGVLRQRLKKGK